MPRYYFHVRDGQYMPDTEGTELPDDTAARTQAMQASGEIIRDLGVSFWKSSEWLMLVVAEDGRLVVTLSLRGKVIEPEPSSSRSWENQQRLLHHKECLARADALSAEHPNLADTWRLVAAQWLILDNVNSLVDDEVPAADSPEIISRDVLP